MRAKEQKCDYISEVRGGNRPRELWGTVPGPAGEAKGKEKVKFPWEKILRPLTVHMFGEIRWDRCRKREMKYSSQSLLGANNNKNQW